MASSIGVANVLYAPILSIHHPLRVCGFVNILTVAHTPAASGAKTHTLPSFSNLVCFHMCAFM